MRVAKALIAAVALLASLGGCYYYPTPAFYYYPTPTIAVDEQPTALTRCGRCEAHAASVPPTPY